MNIRLEGSWAYLEDFILDEKLRVYEALSVEDKSKEYIRRRFGNSAGNSNLRRFMPVTWNKFPIGLQSRVEPVKTYDFQPNFDIHIGKHELRDYQVASVKAGLQYHRGVFEVATNGGKTAIMGKILELLNKRAVVLIHSQEIFKQLISVFRGYNLKVGQIGLGGIEPVNDGVTVALVMTLYNQLGLGTIQDWWDGVEVVMVDECHHAASDTYQRVLKDCQAEYRFGFSGTIPTWISVDGWLCRQWLGDTIAKVTNAQLIERGVSTPVVVTLKKYTHKENGFLWREAISEMTKEYGRLFDNNGKWVKRSLAEKAKQLLFRKIADTCIVSNDERNALLAVEAMEGKGVLVTVDRIEQGQLLKDMIDNDTAFISAESPEREEELTKFASGQRRCLVATSIVDEGIDIKGINKVVVAGGMKSRRKLLQRLGRGMRIAEDKHVVEVFDIMDEGIRYLDEHADERAKVYQEEGFVVQII